MNNSTNVNGALSVFLVDDDAMFLKSLEHHLQQKLKNKVNIKTFSTGEECLKNLDQNPSIIVLDYYLDSGDEKVMDGVQVLEKIKLANPNINVIMLSGQEKIQVAIDSMKHGAFDYVIKNENALMKIHNTIRNVMKSIKMTEQLKFYKWFTWILVTILSIITIVGVVFSIISKQ